MNERSYLVQTTTGIDGAALDGLVDNSGQRCQEVAAENLGIEEDLRTQESFIAHIDLCI